MLELILGLILILVLLSFIEIIKNNKSKLIYEYENKQSPLYKNKIKHDPLYSTYGNRQVIFNPIRRRDEDSLDVDYYKDGEYRPVRFRGDYHPPQKNNSPHNYYDPAIKSSLLSDTIASYIPNQTMNQKHLGQSYDYLTNYKYYIVKNHEQYHKRNKHFRSWWDN